MLAEIDGEVVTSNMGDMDDRVCKSLEAPPNERDCDPKSVDVEDEVVLLLIHAAFSEAIDRLTHVASPHPYGNVESGDVVLIEFVSGKDAPIASVELVAEIEL